ncbi:hypothetical protein MJO28_014867 [Puccinia striiformis f. sp. tritici]|uniref:Uncharacterized protein n=2 Tax=Puccinia striiformis f. sp. tritici TaxID=168172 RepID=A0A0L0UY26_9BASI|nr:hypothetical protein Pst134EA_027749 [Puccinia striiformis f. sp. tritici]KAH9448439.1 hypothetical protein Pst134EA_027749 [Puccinia striiformis f. sp. tritici]KAI7937947.1 hypothetical protein MJO28_014867 [Puccinia striiformis f. sp. tritici]KAI9608141.1 hypothetical protein H4Q26_005597 [Puccinia striiformis f. sp. tritici PST-130]KNE91952.1 hypothetical protein PSTG_14623 [Puccinia striiformis f. sp. tritici PST-78]
MWLEPTSNATELTNTLAGISCGSLNQLTLSKNAPIKRSKSSPDNNNHNQSFYHGLLPKIITVWFSCWLIYSHRPSLVIRGELELNPRPFDLSKLNLEIEIKTVLDQVHKTTKRDWDLSSIFGKLIARKCGLTSASIIKIIKPSSHHHEEVRPTIHPHAHVDGLPINGIHSYDILKNTHIFVFLHLHLDCSSFLS